MRNPKFVRYFVIGGLYVMTRAGGQATAADRTKVPAPVITNIQMLIGSVALNPSSVTGGAQVTGTVTLNHAAPAGGVAVALKSSDSKVVAIPPGVTVQPGATSATFIAQTYPVSMNPNVVASPPSVQISAQIGSSAPKVANLTVAPPTLTALTLNPASVGGGSNVSGTVTISGPAPTGGLAIALATNAPISNTKPQLVLTGIARSRSVSLPSQVTIPAGATSASFAISTRPVSASTTFQVTASWGAFVTKTANLTLLPPNLASLSVNPYAVAGGNEFTVTVTLTAPAPAEGMTVKLATDRASGGTTGTFAQCGQFPSVPSTVTIVGGAKSANFKMATYPGYGVYWVTATSTTTTAYQNVSFDVYSPLFNPIIPSTAKGGAPLQGTIQLTGVAMSSDCGNRYFIKSSNTNFAQVPAYVDLTPGTTQHMFPITTSALPSSAAPVTVTISVTGTSVRGNIPPPAPQATVSANLTITP